MGEIGVVVIGGCVGGWVFVVVGEWVVGVWCY